MKFRLYSVTNLPDAASVDKSDPKSTTSVNTEI
jgi:hypothetical protein